MKWKLIHPLWTHLAAVAAVIWLLIRLCVSLPLPDSAPLHFSLSGAPDSYGSPWLVIGLILILSIFYIGISIFLDELWARQETRKTFNWLSLFDDIIVGFMVGVNSGYLSFLSSGSTSFTIPWQNTLAVTGIILLIALILEYLRPFKIWQTEIIREDTSDLENELNNKLAVSSPVLFWQSQNPGYVTILSISLSVIMFAAAASLLGTVIWISAILFAVGLLLIALYGGQRVLVTQQSVQVRFGLFGIHLITLPISEIDKIEIHSFSPLKDFGGYGIRFNREMKAFFLRGNRGVKITRTDGKVFLIGSDHPEHLETAIRTIHAFLRKNK